MQEGWSNIHREPILASCLFNGTKSYLFGQNECGSAKKTSDYCAELASNEIKTIEEQTGKKVSLSILSFLGFCLRNRQRSKNEKN
jgi:hypothetical protein